MRRFLIGLIAATALVMPAAAMAQRHGGHGGGGHDRGGAHSGGDRGGYRGDGGNRGNRGPQSSRPAQAPRAVAPQRAAPQRVAPRRIAPQRDMAISPRQSRPTPTDRRGGMVRNWQGKDRVQDQSARSFTQGRQIQARPDRNDRRGNNWRDGRRHDGRGGHAEGRRDWRGSWNRGWRNDHRYNWRGWRSANRRIYHLRPYYAPYRGWSYRRFGIGIFLDPLFFGQSYWIGDPFYYRLPPAPPGTQWVRYYNDVLLVDIYSGEVVDAIYDFFW